MHTTSSSSSFFFLLPVSAPFPSPFTLSLFHRLPLFPVSLSLISRLFVLYRPTSVGPASIFFPLYFRPIRVVFFVSRFLCISPRFACSFRPTTIISLVMPIIFLKQYRFKWMTGIRNRSERRRGKGIVVGKAEKIIIELIGQLMKPTISNMEMA